MAKETKSGIAGAFLDGVEFVGNKLPDPAVLFLLGALLILGMSHVLAPAMPGGFEVRFVADPVNGDVDGHVAQIVESESDRIATVKAVANNEGEFEARLFVEGEETPVLDESGAPIDFRDRGWAVFVQRPVDAVDPDTGETIQVLEPTGEVNIAVSLMSVEGLFWCLKSMEDNFMGFAPLGVVLLGILGIGVAERTGLIAALLKTFMLVVPRNLLTPTMVFLGIMSSIGSDAGYIVLPPLAAAIYLAAGRSPLAGIAAVFAGVSAGFNANLLITTLEPIMANFTANGAQVIDSDRQVVPTASWWFMAVSTFLITGVGWLTTALFVEKRLSAKSPEDGGPDPALEEPETDSPWTVGILVGLIATVTGIGVGVSMIVGGFIGDEPARVVAIFGFGVLVLAGVFGVSAVTYGLAKKGLEPIEAKGVFAASLFVTGLPTFVAFVVLMPDLFPSITQTPLSGMDGVAQRWVSVVVPIMLFVFAVPGYVYGIVTGGVTDTKAAAKLMIESIAGMAPIIVLAFFAGQFVAYFGQSNVGRMLALAGGEWLFTSGFESWTLLVAFILVTMVFNLFVGSMSAKFALFAPIFVPMFMLAGIRPEMTMVAYRIGDSVTNTITPLNAYLIIILVYMQKYAKNSGMGTLIAMMLPYTITFVIAWTVLLLLWDASGFPLGLGDPGQVFSPEFIEATAAPGASAGVTP
ncbi:MAG: AbgT family transporter [Planctomycetota bacterium]